MTEPSVTDPKTGSQKDSLSVTLATSVAASQVRTGQSGEVLQECAIDYQATASGSSGARAVWEDATFLWYIGADRAAPFDSMRVSASKIREAWGGDTLTVGSSVRTRWKLWAGVPFQVRANVRYRIVGQSEVRTATVDQACGPEAPSGTAAPPVISDVVLAAGDEVESGDTIALTYTARSSAGLWKSVIRISGAYVAAHEVAEHPSKSATRTIRMVVPPGASLGSRIRLRVEAVDIAAQTTASEAFETTPLVDRTPPSMLWLSMHPLRNGVLAGSYATTDTLSFTASVGDNHGLGYLVYEFSAPMSLRDSVRLDGFRADGITVRLPVQSGWVGTPTLRVYARDASGLQGGESASQPDSIRIYPVVNRTVRTADFSAPRHEDAVLDSGRRRLYVAVPASKRIEVLSLETMTFGAPIALPTAPGELDISSSGDSLLVALPEQDALAVIDLARSEAAPSYIPVAAASGASPTGVRVMSGGKALIPYYSPEGSGIYLLDLQSGSLRVLLPGSSSAGLSVARTVDRSRAILLDRSLSCVRLYTAATDEVTGCRGRPNQSGSLSADAAGRRFAIGLEIFDENANFSRMLSAFEVGATRTSAISLDGSYVFVSTHKGLVRVRAWDGMGEERMPVPPINGRILMSPDGSYLVAVNELVDGSGRIQVLEVDLR